MVDFSTILITPFTIEHRITFISHLITDDADGSHDIFPVDLDVSGDLDIVSAEWSDSEVVWYKKDGDQNCSVHIISTKLCMPAQSGYRPGRG